MGKSFSRRGIRKGRAVYWIQQNLYWLNFNNADNRDGEFGPKTEYWVRQFQKHKGLKEDGIVGAATIKALWEEVKKYQGILSSLSYRLVPDGLAGPLTFRATRDFQYKRSLPVDGICGPNTRRKLTERIEPVKKIKLTKKVEPKRAAIDIGHLEKDSGAFHGGVKEVSLNLLIGEHLAKGLKEAGHEVKLLSGTLKERCSTANSWRADFVISIHCNAFTDARAHGVEVWYISEAGRRLASLILEGYPLGFHKRGVKKGNFYILRHTEAPCVIVECGFISNPAERELLFLSAPEISKAITNAILKWCS